MLRERFVDLLFLPAHGVLRVRSHIYSSGRRSVPLPRVREPRREFIDSVGTGVVILRTDVFPAGWARGLATVESFIGALSMAYFVSVLSRRAIRNGTRH